MHSSAFTQLVLGTGAAFLAKPAQPWTLLPTPRVSQCAGARHCVLWCVWLISLGMFPRFVMLEHVFELHFLLRQSSPTVRTDHACLSLGGGRAASTLADGNSAQPCTGSRAHHPGSTLAWSAGSHGSRVSRFWEPPTPCTAAISCPCVFRTRSRSPACLSISERQLLSTKALMLRNSNPTSIFLGCALVHISA